MIISKTDKLLHSSQGYQFFWVLTCAINLLQVLGAHLRNLCCILLHLTLSSIIVSLIVFYLVDILISSFAGGTAEENNEERITCLHVGGTLLASLVMILCCYLDMRCYDLLIEEHEVSSTPGMFPTNSAVFPNRRLKDMKHPIKNMHEVYGERDEEDDDDFDDCPMSKSSEAVGHKNHKQHKYTRVLSLPSLANGVQNWDHIKPGLQLPLIRIDKSSPNNKKRKFKVLGNHV